LLADRDVPGLAPAGRIEPRPRLLVFRPQRPDVGHPLIVAGECASHALLFRLFIEGHPEWRNTCGVVRRPTTTSRTPAASRVVSIALQDCLIVLSAVENADDRDLLCVDVEGYHYPLAVIRDAQAFANVIPAIAPMRKRPQLFAVRNDCVDIAFRDHGRGRGRNVAIKLEQLFLRFRCKGDGIGHYAFSMVLRCSAASDARSWSTPMARDGSAFSAS